MTRRMLAVALGALTLVTACGGGDDDDSGGSGETSEAGDEDSTSGAINDVDVVQPAIVRIVASGTFIEPGEEGISSVAEVTGAGSGSGAIIDPSGIVVTNNHVVTGAASLEVFVGENETDPVSGRVLGVSECNDLAVIDLEGDGYPYLAWADENPGTNVDVRAVGFPLGDPEFTVTSGIVSKAEADGDTPWASIPFTIEHDANIQPGNSGGPLLNADDATIVGINYATNDPGTGQNQFFAIAADEARDIVEQLREGDDVLALGVNGQAIYDEESGVVGVWVSSVETGSPASDAGIEPGDIIERIEGLPLGTDGTMKDYCDILRSHDATDVLSVQVLRFAENARLEGEFNGDPLQPVASIVDEVASAAGGSTLAEGEAYEDTTIQDDTGLLVVDVPTAWADIRTETVTDDEGFEYPQIIAAPDAQGFLDTYDVPGMSFAIDVNGVKTVDNWASDFSADCATDGAVPYDDGAYAGTLEVWYDCGPAASQVAVIVAQPPGDEFTVRVVVQALTTADVEAFERIIQSFRVVTE
ncbi:MAG: S1C family serine protease [Acidimicrobiia bacterium]